MGRMEITYTTAAEMQQGLDHIQQAPKDMGSLELIVARTATDKRQTYEECTLTPEAGVPGDYWARGCWKTLPDGSPHPDVQVTLMNARVISLLAQTKDRWALAGDNLIVDMDLSGANLPPGQQLAIGTAILQITDIPHTGCASFIRRYGADAQRFVNSEQGKRLSLRGIYARIVQAGVIRVGDTVRKVP
jgi:MOSC domain-containing protein YiiM